jgi:hypothetical protein
MEKNHELNLRDFDRVGRLKQFLVRLNEADTC